MRCQYPQSRHPDSDQIGEQPYTDGKQTLAKSEAAEHAQSVPAEVDRATPDERREQVEAEMEARFADISRDIASNDGDSIEHERRRQGRCNGAAFAVDVH
jgi:hypothetical protein